MDSIRNSRIGEPASDGRRDFDFFIRDWRISARHLRRGNWEPVKGTTRVIQILQGAGNIDEDEFHLVDKVHVGGMLRLFDAETSAWLTYGVDRNRGSLQPPLSGRFHAGRGVFYGEELRDGRQILVRHIYCHPGSIPATCRWEQAFSSDGGGTWETNWVIDFRRADEPADRSLSPQRHDDTH